MKLIKLEKNFIIIRGEDIIKEGEDEFGRRFENGTQNLYKYDSGEYGIFIKTSYNINNGNFKSHLCQQILYSSQQLTNVTSISSLDNFNEILEQIGEIDIKQYSKCYVEGQNHTFELGYYFCKDLYSSKKYTEEDLIKAIEMARYIFDGKETFDAESISGLTEVCTYDWRFKLDDDDIIKSLQPKTEWNIEIKDNKIFLI